jgi:hypothetical protein
VQVFGRRNDEGFGVLRWLASKKRQGTKSRELGTGGAAALWGLNAGASSMEDVMPMSRKSGYSADPWERVA